VAIKSFTFNRLQTDSFISFGYEQYQGDNNWIPPLKGELYKQLSPHYPFYSKRGNYHRHFLANAGNKVVGRISAMVNSDLRDKDGTPAGIIGFYESVDDYSVAADLLDVTMEWLHDEHGLKRIWGPMNFDIWHSYRFMTKGYDLKLFYGEPYNKSYYPDFFERYGFVYKQLWDSVEITRRNVLENMIVRGAERYQMLLDRGYRFEQFNVKEFKNELRKLHNILIKSFSGFLGFTHVSFEEFEQLVARSRYALNPRFTVLIYDENNILAGFAVALLELSDAIRAMKGKDSLVSKVKFIYNRSRVTRINFYAGGATPEEMVKMSGLGRAGFYYIIQQILNEGYEDVIFSLRTKHNRSRSLLGRNLRVAKREYVLYEVNL
jgi:hypothetical protein